MDNTLAIWLWLALSVTFILLEILVIPGVWMFWFAIPAAITGVISWIFSDLSWGVQFAIFSILSMVMLVILMKFGKKVWQNSDNTNIPLNQRGSEYIGRVIVLEVPVVNGEALIKLGDSYWTVRGEDVPTNTKIKLTSQNSNVFYFEKAE